MKGIKDIIGIGSDKIELYAKDKVQRSTPSFLSKSNQSFHITTLKNDWG